ncbi:unnamed protein product [Prorocentrum cordatum]|uniref:Reverse transcriptase domain-containing protein n=1 Tax=Prorocentrum cordatum TaxID=2364126 RepID=A0ABN9Y5Y5_9DINO|nr:unnamed protein product [Polarella glacialis]
MGKGFVNVFAMPPLRKLGSSMSNTIRGAGRPLDAGRRGRGRRDPSTISFVKFVDDLIAMTVTDSFEGISEFLFFLQAEIEKRGLRPNIPKTELMVGIAGQGCKKLRRQVKSKQTGVHMKSRDGARFDVHALPHVKYLGVRLSVQGAMREEVAARLQTASLVHGRLSQRIFRDSTSTRLRVRLWCSLVRSIALYALEVAILTQTEATRLERWQKRRLRRMLQPPAHLYRVPNEGIRRKVQLHSVQSTLLFRRLKWRQQVIKPGLEDDPPEYDPSKAVRAVVFGRLSFESPHKLVATARLKLLLEDLRLFWQAASAEFALEPRLLENRRSLVNGFNG